MPVRVPGSRGRRRPSPRARLRLEHLEARCLLSAGPGLGPIHEAAGTDTLDRFQGLGELTGPVEVLGSITGTPADPADVDWYRFTLAGPARVTLSATARAGQQGPVLSL
jgi:hypothetical protein